MAETLPADLEYLDTPPELIRSVSVSRYGGRVVSAIENGDPFWQWSAEVMPMRPFQRQRLEAFIDRCRGGQVTVHYTPKHVRVPYAYWGDVDNPAITGSASLGAINGNLITLTGVFVGLRLTDGDLIGLSLGDYNFIARIVSSAVATSTTIEVRIEPFLPSYIRVGAIVRFKDIVMNMRLLPNSFKLDTGNFPRASFQLVEVPS
ncbi:hypothetical protein [Brucella intermedia]|uniref:hypothetical protein n=1 Tax=Brucella intermedia TaxID=94625 RepID=UPI002360766E|nr:hypothetical protein [Brucella intermedia]